MATKMMLRSIRDQIGDAMRDELLCGRISAGTRLSEEELARQFGVSRGPIREVFAQLTNEGLLVSRPNAGVTVAPEPPDQIREVVIPIRRTIETYALKLIFADLGQKDFQHWDEILLRMERACRDGDVEEIVLQDIAFHRRIIVSAAQADLLAIWRTILGRIRGHFRADATQLGPTLLEIHACHQRLLQVFRAGDLQAAVADLEHHIC